MKRKPPSNFYRDAYTRPPPLEMIPLVFAVELLYWQVYAIREWLQNMPEFVSSSSRPT